MRILRSVISLLLCAALAGANLAAQQHVVDAADLQQLLDTRADDEEALRAVVHRVLARPEVERVAQGLGVDLGRAVDAVSTLDGAELAQMAAQARAVDTSLAGGQGSITVSTTMIIIGLLVLILIVVVVS